MATVPVGMDMYLPALPEIGYDFNASTKQVTLTIALFFIGNTIGQLVGGPISDNMGRKYVACFGMALFMLCAIGMLFAPSIEYVQYLRCLQGMASGFMAVIVFATLRDVYTNAQLGAKMATVMMAVMLCQILAPFIGASLLQISWRLIFALMGVLVGILLMLYLWRWPETSPRMTKLSAGQFLRNYYQVINAGPRNNLLALRYLGVMGMTMAVNLSFVSSSAFIYREYFGTDAFVFSILFALSILCMVLCTNYSRMQMARGHSSFRALSNGLRAHLFVVSIFFLMCLLSQPTLWTVVPALICISGFIGLVTPHCMALYLKLFDRLAGSAVSCATACNFMCGGIAGVIIAYFHDGSLLPIAICMLCASLLANAMRLSITPSWVREERDSPY